MQESNTRNIQVIDNAENCTYSIFKLEESVFRVIFPNGQDVEFIEDLVNRIGEEKVLELLAPMWKCEEPKSKVIGIHGTLFYQLEFKKKYYPSKKESEMVIAL
ncbi:MAG: hypothetical protein V7776_10480 [Halopseudomonas aestusnigri]